MSLRLDTSAVMVNAGINERVPYNEDTCIMRGVRIKGQKLKKKRQEFKTKYSCFFLNKQMLSIGTLERILKYKDPNSLLTSYIPFLISLRPALKDVEWCGVFGICGCSLNPFAIFSLLNSS